MSLSDIDQPAADNQLAAAGHEEIHECLRLLRKHDELLEAFRPLLDRYSAVAGSPAARWAKRRNGTPIAFTAHVPACQGIAHDVTAHCARTGPHNWHPLVGCHVDPGECGG